MNTRATYPEFEHEAKRLKKYLEAAGVFSFLLEDGNVIHFIPASKENFTEWLKINNVPNMRDW